MPRSVTAIAPILMLASIATPCMYAADVTNPALERKFSQTVRPFLTQYCIGCHSGETPAAQFDLQPYSTVAAVVRDYPRWALVLERLTAKEMPPKPLPQPPADARQEVIDWVASRAHERGTQERRRSRARCWRAA